MNVGSLFTGVGGFDLGFERAGMRIVFQCELDPWCRGILAQHWPGVPCYSDVRNVRAAHIRLAGERSQRHELARQRATVDRTQTRRNGRSANDEDLGGVDGPLDLLCGGFPCQDLSVAGKRRGLAGERSGLFFEFARIADELVRPGGWIVIENVPGLLSSANGRDFAIVLRTLGDIGFHDLAWRVLDSRYFGVPQRRRRVFIVGRRAAGDGAREVLLEPESGGGNFAPSSQTRQGTPASFGVGVAGTLGRGAKGGRTTDLDNHGAYVRAVTSKWRKGTGGPAGDEAQNLIAHTLRAEGFDASEDGTGRGTPLVSATADAHGVRTASGLPGRVDDPQPDGPRYSAMGNAVSVPVLEWIGRRIMEYENRRER